MFKKLKGIAEEINRERNAIVHQGQFRNRNDAAEVIAHAREFIETVVKLYEPNFALKDNRK
jgi:hypothetical protein